MGFILNILFDAAVLTSVAAGVRRTTGINLAQMARNRIQHPGWQTAVQAYFGAGEWMVTKSLELVNKAGRHSATTASGTTATRATRSLNEKDKTDQ